MRLIRRMLFFIISVICVIPNVIADCTYGKTTLKDGRQFIDTVNLNKCESVGALISDKKANSFKLSCVKTKFKCIAQTCPNNLSPDKNGICSTINASEQSRFHKNLLTHTYQKRHFFDACTSLTASENQNKTVIETQNIIPDLNRKIKYACITDFANYKLSTALAIGLIERYNWSNGIGQIRADNCTTQQNDRFKSGGGHSVRCLADNGIYVEFLFGKMNSMSTSREDIAGAVCPVFGFQHLDSNGNQHRCHGKKSFKDMAAFIQQNELMDIKNVDNGYFEIIPVHKDIIKNDDLSKVLDTDIFKDVVTYATAHIKVLLKKYISDRLKSNGYEIESIKFYSARVENLNTTQGWVWPVEIFACKKNNCKSYIKLFKFKSLCGNSNNNINMHFASWVSLGVEQMACLMKDGLFDSKHCFFLEEDINNEKKQCFETNSLIQSTFARPSNTAKAEFDTKNNMCVLYSSNKNATTLKNVEIGSQILLLTVTTVATAGAGTALGIGLAAGGLLADGITLATDVAMNKSSVKFLKLSTRCHDATCAKKYFEQEFEHMLRLMDRINDDEFKVIDSEMDRLVKLLDDKYLNDKYATELADMKNKTTGFFNNMSTEETIETVAIVVSVGLSITSASKGIKALIAKSKKVEPKFMKSLATRLNKMKTTAKTKNTVNKTDDIVDAGTAVPKTQIVTDADGTKTINISLTEAEARNAAVLRKEASESFDVYLLEVKQSRTGIGQKLPKDNLTDAGWNAVNKSLAPENVQLVDTGDGYMQFMRADHIDDTRFTLNKSLSDIEDAAQQKLSDDVLYLQRSQGMNQKVDRYNDVLKRAKNSLSPEEYKTFENMLDLETTIQEQENYILQVEQNLRHNNFSEHSIDSYINDSRQRLTENKTRLYNLRKNNPKITSFFDDNYSSLMDPHSVISQSNDAIIQKKINMTAEISKRVDDVALRKGVEQFKDDIIANFSRSMYQKAKNWDNMPGADKANFIANELIPYLEKIQGVDGTKIEVKLMPRSHIGGNAAFCDKTNCLQVSFEALNETSFENILTTLTHENIHAGQYINGGRSSLTKEIVNISDINYVAALRNLGANKANAVEREAYMTTGMFNNILKEIAEYHHW